MGCREERRYQRNADVRSPRVEGPRRFRSAAPRGSLGAPRGHRVPDHLGAVHRLGHELRPGGVRPEGLPHHAAERPDGGGAVLRRGERLHAHLRAHARRQHGPRRVLPARRLHRAAHPAQHGGRLLRRRALQRAGVNLGQWIVPTLVAGRDHRGVLGLDRCSSCSCAGTRGRTSARRSSPSRSSIILADQMLAHFGGIAQDISWPSAFDKFVDLKVAGVQYTLTRLIILGIGLAVGLGLWYLAEADTRHGHGDPRRRRRPRDGLRDRDQHPARRSRSRSPSGPRSPASAARSAAPSRASRRASTRTGC